MPLRVAAIDFLNPAPLMWDFNHEPLSTALAEHYTIHLTTPAQCAQQLVDGSADLGLIPIAALTPQMHIVPGCTIASQARVRSIQLVVKAPLALEQVRTIAADTSSRSSTAYVEVIFRHFLGKAPIIHAAPPDLPQMLRTCDAALIIGDPALLAVERRDAIEAFTGPCQWYDVAELWRQQTGLPWVAAVWALRPDVVLDSVARSQLTQHLNLSREHGLMHAEDLVREWSTRLPLPPEVIRTYLTQNISYSLSADCLRAISVFRQLAAEHTILPPLGELRLLG